MATAIYGRQSVDKKDSISIEAQIGLCKKECNGESNFKIYTDKGYSGKNTDRPQFRRMMQDVKSGLIDRVVVYRLDRLSRSITDFGHMWEELNSFHVSTGDNCLMGVREHNPLVLILDIMGLDALVDCLHGAAKDGIAHIMRIGQDAVQR